MAALPVALGTVWPGDSHASQDEDVAMRVDRLQRYPARVPNGSTVAPVAAGKDRPRTACHRRWLHSACCSRWPRPLPARPHAPAGVTGPPRTAAERAIHGLPSGPGGAVDGGGKFLPQRLLGPGVMACASIGPERGGRGPRRDHRLCRLRRGQFFMSGAARRQNRSSALWLWWRFAEDRWQCGC
jgi:hypothetical protein